MVNRCDLAAQDTNEILLGREMCVGEDCSTDSKGIVVNVATRTYEVPKGQTIGYVSINLTIGISLI